MKKLLVLLVAAGAMASCCNCYKATERSQISLTGDGWQVIRMEGRMFEADGDSFTLTFGDDGRVAGTGACNRLNGPYSSDNGNGTMSFGALVATRKMCPDQANENKFMKLLGTVDGYTIDGRLLMLFRNGEQIMMLERIAAK